MTSRQLFSTLLNVSICLVALSCGARIEESSPDASTFDEWVEIQSSAESACVRSRAGRVVCMSSRFTKEWTIPQKQYDGIAMSNYFDFAVLYSNWGAEYFGESHTPSVLPNISLSKPAKRYFVLGYQEYCALPEEGLAVPVCTASIAKLLPKGMRFSALSTSYGYEYSRNTHYPLFGITEGGKLWCSAFGEKCHQLYGLADSDKVVQLIDRTNAVLTDSGKVVSVPAASCGDLPCGESPLTKVWEPGTDIKRVVTHLGELLALHQDGHLSITDDWGIYMRTDLRQHPPIDDLLHHRFIDISGDSCLCGIILSGEVLCWLDFPSLHYGGADIIPPEELRLPHGR